MTEDQIALQLYTVRQLTATDMLGTLRQLAALGYRAVELAGYGNATPASVREVLQETGLQAIAAHVGLDRWVDTDALLEELTQLGCLYAVVPSIPREHRQDLAYAKAAFARFNSYAERCRAHGLRFAYHNHDFEFAQLAGGTIWDALQDAVDHTLVDLELDVFWARRAGRDPLDLINLYTGRLPLLHVKDMRLSDGADLPVGSGVLPWDTILPAAEQAGTRWFIVEQDTPQSPLADVETSLRYLQSRQGDSPL